MSKLLLYCTKAKPYLYHNEDYCFDTMNTIDLGYKTFEYTNQRVYDDETGKFLCWETYGNMYKDYALNGKIVAECDFEVEEITFRNGYIYETDRLFGRELQQASYLTFNEMHKYLNGKNGYAIHIKNLHIFDKPKETKDYRTYNRNGKVHIANIPIYTAPQNMMYAFDYYGNPFVLISIKPEWLCKILNGEKTIEIRKKVLKEMMCDE